MTDPTNAVPKGLADYPLEVRRQLEIEIQREVQEGMTHRHLANAAFAKAYEAVQFDRAVRMGQRKG